MSQTSKLTKAQLKEALIARRIPTPPKSAKKEEFQKVYDANVAKFEKRSEFSSDDGEEEDDDDDRDDNSSQTEVNEEGFEVGRFEVLEMQSPEQVKGMDDSTLFSNCVQAFGRDKVGPILDNTRAIYQKMLSNHYSSLSLSSAESSLNSSRNGNMDSHVETNGYSDSDNDEEAARVARASRASASRASATPSNNSNRSSTRRSREQPDSQDDRSPVAKMTRRENVSSARTRVLRELPRAETPVEFTIAHGRPTPIRDVFEFDENEGPAERGSGGFNFAQRASGEAAGLSYFKERPGYPSVTNTNVLPIKPNNSKTDTKPKTKEQEPELSRLRKIFMILFMIGMIFLAWYIKVYVFEDSSSGNGDNIDELLESLQDN